MTAAQVINDRRTVDKLVAANRKLVYLVANRYRGKFWEAQEDIEGAGMLGLVKAAQRYDPATGNKFSSLAVVWIRGEILRFIRERGGRPKTSRAQSDLYMKHHKLPDKEAAVQAGVTLEDWIKIRQSNSVSLVTYDTQVHDSYVEDNEINEDEDCSKLESARAMLSEWLAEFESHELEVLDKICRGKGKKVELELVKERLAALLASK
jgi:RNA polymerase sigma factor (sigma-70 family)